MLRCHPNTVRAWIRKGKLTPILMGEEKVPMLPRKDVLRFRKPLETAGVLSRDVHHAFPVVGIGASAGGTDAVTALLKGIPTDLGLAYVFVSHLEKGRESTLAEVMRKRTAMPVLIAENGMRLQPDRFYVGPSGMHLAIVNGTFTLTKPRGKGSALRPIDAFFTAIAEEFQNNAIGIVLSGTGNDGTEGLAAIRAQDGLTIVQDGTAREGGMPQSASDAGVVDIVQEPGAMGRTLAQLVKQLYPGGKARIPGKHENEMRRILRYVEEQRGVDFSQYKEKTIQRRIIRRMILSQCKDLSAYSLHLRGTPSEVDVLCSDLLINVSAFFRDPDFFKALRHKILPALFKDRSPNDPLRIWVAGCSGGEEVISIAITVIEYQTEHQLSTPVQLFATDLNERNIEKARLGVYKKSALRDIGEDRIQRFFMYVDDHFQVIKAIRDMCVFARHDLLKDPPFSRVDLISCQNVLIYLDNAVQGRVLRSFHYALRQDGILCLGRSETTGDASELFTHPERDKRFYRKKPKKLGRLDLDVHFKPQAPQPGPLGMGPAIRTATEVSADLDAAVERSLQQHLPPSVLVNQDLEIVRFRGNVAPFLGPSTGKASLHLLKMVRDDLSFELRMLLNRARKEGKVVRKGPIPMRRGDTLVEARMEVEPVGEERDRHYLVIFKEEAPRPEPAPSKNGRKGPRSTGDARDRRIAQLEKELYEAREQVRLVSEESEQATQELQSANEEVVSSNEELQSINEELETSKEELQSVNEEFATINEELQARNDELRESEERFRLLGDSMAQLAWIGDEEGRVIWFNRKWMEFTGEELAGLSAEERGRIIHHPDHSARVRSSHERGIKEGKVWEEVFPMRRKDGQYRWFLSRSVPVRDAEGRITKWFGTNTDITETRSAQEHLREREERLTMAADAASLGIFEMDLDDGTMLWENERMYAIFGRSQEQGPFSRRDLFEEVLHPDDRKATVDMLEKAIARERDLRCKCRVLNEALGEHRMVEVAARVEQDEEGRPWRLVGVIADVTERERSALMASRLAAIVEHSDDAVMGMDLEGNITDWNRGAERMYGYAAGEILGQHVSILLPQERENEEPAIIARIRRGEHVQHYETARMHKDGTLIDVSLSISPIRDDQHTITGISKIARDVTTQRAMAREIERATEQLKLVADHMPVAVTRCSMDLRYIWVSKGYLDWVGLEQHEVDGRPIREVLGEKAYGTIEPYLQRVMAGERVEYEARLEPRSRPLCWINATYVPVRDPDTGQDGWIAVITDITRRKELEAALQEADRHKDHFLATLAHELRGPLAPLKNGLSLLEMAEGDQEMIDTTRGMMERQMDHLVRLVDDLMDLNRISRGKIQLKREKVTLAEVVATATEANRPAMEQAGHTLDLQLEADGIVVDGDPARLTQVFVNLLHNATKYTPSGGRIVLRLERDTRTNEAVISVTDNGIGIEPEALSKVFEMFAQTDKAQKIQAGGGLGIGLNIVQRLVQMHGGSVAAHSEGDGKGSRFTVRLPIDSAPDGADAPTPTATQTNAPSARKRKILVVDDNEDASLTMSMILTKLGHEVLTAGDGMQALIVGEAFGPDIIFMDIGMPQMDGYEACRRMRTTAWAKGATIIALSGWGQEEDRRLSEEAGFDRHVVKPIDGSTLRNILKELEGK